MIELGRQLPDLEVSERNEPNKVHGCASQVWLVTEPRGETQNPVLDFRGDSDALIVKGLIAILLTIYSGKSAREILKTDALSLLGDINLQENLSRQRSNGLVSMVNRIKSEAQAALG